MDGSIDGRTDRWIAYNSYKISPMHSWKKILQFFGLDLNISSYISFNQVAYTYKLFIVNIIEIHHFGWWKPVLCWSKNSSWYLLISSATKWKTYVPQYIVIDRRKDLDCLLVLFSEGFSTLNMMSLLTIWPFSLKNILCLYFSVDYMLW